MFKTVVAFLFIIPGLASAVAATSAYYIAEFQVTDREAIKSYSTQVESTFSPLVDTSSSNAALPELSQANGAYECQ